MHQHSIKPAALTLTILTGGLVGGPAASVQDDTAITFINSGQSFGLPATKGKNCGILNGHLLPIHCHGHGGKG